MRRKDVISGIIIGIFSLCYLSSVQQIHIFYGAGTGPLTARFFPSFLGIVLLLLSICLIVRGNKEKNISKKQEKEPAVYQNKGSGFRKTIFTIVLLALYIYFLDILGFIISTFLYLCSQMMLLIPYAKAKWIIIAFISAFLGLAIDFIFVKFFHVMLPKGILGF